MKELNGDIALFTPGGKHLDLITKGLSPEHMIINAKFEKA